MRLGVINGSTATIDLFTFDIVDLTWSNPSVMELSLAKEPFGEGGFREAFKASSKVTGLCNQQWVVKRYLESAADKLQQTMQTDIRAARKKVVQMQNLAKTEFTKKPEKKVQLNGNLKLYGKTLTCRKIYTRRIHGHSGDEKGHC